jgi:hypothetical protein
LQNRVSRRPPQPRHQEHSSNGGKGRPAATDRLMDRFRAVQAHMFALCSEFKSKNLGSR